MSPPRDVGSFLRNVNTWVQTATGSQPGRKAPRVLFDDMEADIASKTNFMRKQDALLKEIMQDYSCLVIRINILQIAFSMLHSENSSDHFPSQSEDLTSPLLGSSPLDRVKIGYIGGACPKQEQLALKKLVFRAMRGRAFIYYYEIPEQQDTLLKGLDQKVLFIIVYQTGEFVYQRLRKLCESASPDIL